MKRRAAELESQAPAPPAEGAAPPRKTSWRGIGHAADIHRYGEDLERRYIVARDAWLKAMQAANSGRPVDLASLAIAQEAYEAVAIEREEWLASDRIAIPIGTDASRHNIEIAVGQELRWRQVHEQKPPGVLARIRRRLGGR